MGSKSKRNKASKVRKESADESALKNTQDSEAPVARVEKVDTPAQVNGNVNAEDKVDSCPPATTSNEIVDKSAKVEVQSNNVPSEEAEVPAVPATEEVVPEPTIEEETSAPTENGEVESSPAPEEPEKLVLKYSYETDQWSPVNQEGKKFYTRKLLLLIREDELSKVMPENLPNLEIVRNKVRSSYDRNSMSVINSGSMGACGGLSDFTPNYMRNQGNHRDNKNYSLQMHRGGSSSMRSGIKKAPKIIDAKPNAGKISLKTVENAWVPASKSADSINDEQKVIRKLRSCLNKLCPESFERIKDQMREVIIQNDEFMIPIVGLIFEKAIVEQYFAGEYAKVCKYVSEKNEKDSPDQAQIASTFKKTLLLKCQNEFEKKHKEAKHRNENAKKLQEQIKNCKDPAEKEKLQQTYEEKYVDKSLQERLALEKEIESTTDQNKLKELEDKLESLQDLSRKKSVGLIKYVAELYKEQLLPVKIVLGLLMMLVQDIHRPEQAEILCKLFICIGGILWKALDNNEKNKMKDCINAIRRHSTDKGIENRIKFLLLDVIDLYENDFVAKHMSHKQQGPTTKRQVLENMSNEQHSERQAAIAATSNSYGGHSGGARQRDNYGRRNDRGSNSRDLPLVENSDHWKTVVNNNSSNRKNVSLKNFSGKGSNHGGETQRLGPSGGSMSTWGKGASGGAGAGNRDIRVNTNMNHNRSSNRFANLCNDEDMGESDMPRRPNQHQLRQNPFINSRMDERNSYSRDFGRAPNSSNDRSNSMGRRIPESSGAIGGANSGDQRNKSLSREAPNDFYRPRKVSPEVPPPAPAVPQLSEDQIRAKSTCIFGEYCNVLDIDGAIANIHDMLHASNCAKFVNIVLLEATEKKADVRESAGKLLVGLFAKKVLLLKDFKEEMVEVMGMLADLAIDVPQIGSYFGTMLGPSVLAGHIKLTDLWEMAQHAEDMKEKFFLDMLKFCLKEEDELIKFWINSGLKWKDILEAELKDKTLARYNLECLNVSEEMTLADVYSRSLEKQKIDFNNREEVKKAVKKLVSPAVGYVNNKIDVTDYEGLCLRFDGLKLVLPESDNMQEIELSVVYGLQALAVQHKVPSGLLAVLFEGALETKLVSPNTFDLWEEGSSEEEGTGMCVTQVKTFLRKMKSDSQQ